MFEEHSPGEADYRFVSAVTGRRLSYSVGFTLPDDFAVTLPRIPKQAWTPAVDADGQVRDGAWVAHVTDLLNLSRWPAGMRVIVGKERPHPGAQPRLTDPDGLRVTAFATNTARPRTEPGLVRHRRARLRLFSVAARLDRPAAERHHPAPHARYARLTTGPHLPARPSPARPVEPATTQDDTRVTVLPG